MISTATSYYGTKSQEYFSGARADFVERLPANHKASILEIGCSSGGTGALALSEGKCIEYTGIDLVPDIVEQAKNKLTKVILTDLENEFPDLEPEQFDALIASEIFEHLRDPWAVLEKLVPLLKPGAMVLASSPNISHNSVLKDLRKGHFNYKDMGIMDRTHLRWFTPNSYKALFTEAGLVVTDMWPFRPIKIQQKLIAKFLPNGQKTFWRQICIEAKKP